LSRNEHNDDSDNLQSEQKKVARVGTKTASIKHNLTESIERNVANLNASLESEYSTDPMFHKMSQAFDEGGAKGMLMANLVRIFYSYFYLSVICDF
jgi:condensin complex subunit 2